MTNLETIILAVVEGLTEFLPISSTGHMMLAQGILKMPASDFTKVFLINIQFGAILAVVLYYYKRFLKSFDFYIKLAIAFIPAAILGFLLNDFIDGLLESVTTVAVMLILGGIVMVYIDRYFNAPEPETEYRPHEVHGQDVEVVPDIRLNYLQSLKIGFFQCIAMIPGVSRAAATIIGGYTQGLSRKEAAEFSFLLAVPTLAAAALYKTYKYGDKIHAEDIQTLIIGNAVAFVVAFISIHFLIHFLVKYGMKYFGYYRIALGIFILIGIFILKLPIQIIN